MANLARKFKSMDMRIKGFYGAKARWWLNTVAYNRKNSNNFSQDEKEWAYKHGFLPEIVERYGITKDTYKDYISIYDYAFLYPINDIFRKWVKDRVTTRNVLKPYKEYMPKQYFHMYKRDRELMIIKLLDCPKECDDTLEGIVELIKKERKVALRKTVGLGKIIIQWKEDENCFLWDGKQVLESKLKTRLKSHGMEEIYVITEVIEADEDFVASDNTESSVVLRLMVYNKYADNPRIGQAYLRVDDGENTIVIDDMAERIGDNIKEFNDGNEEQREINSDDGVYERNFIEDQVVLPKDEDLARTSRCKYYPINLDTGKIGDGLWINNANHIANIGPYKASVIPGWGDINRVVEDLCKFIPQMEIMGIDVAITKDGFVLLDFNDQPYYPQTVGFNQEMTDYLKMKIEQKYAQAKDRSFRRKNLLSKSNTFLWVRLTKLFCPPNMRPLIYKWWYVTVKADLFSHNGIKLKDKIWAYKKGFLSYRLPQYGITKDNYQEFISDYDYRYLRHINNKYRVWLEDKITVKYICSDHGQYFPKYYYHVSVRNGEKRIIPLMDLPDYCTNNLESIFELVKHEGQLACKPQRGSQGQGFYKLSYHEGKYYLNHEEANREDILEILGNPESQYLITEYIKQHPVIDNIYSGAVNTMRIITFMKDGKTQEIGNAYMRFGSKKTGAVDNMGAGGMFVQVDMETGRFYNGKIITENEILPCSKHPDTGALIEGILPNWDIIKKGIKELNDDMPQLEYLGFDVAITEDGMKLPEINRAPGYPKIETFQRPTIDYLLYKKSVKMKDSNIKKTKW
ncbi:MAG: hypothetical protein MJ146_03120 [Clostridia bacterium]|nr:hypothetical protein [Clostridia bacterium]